MRIRLAGMLPPTDSAQIHSRFVQGSEQTTIRRGGLGDENHRLTQDHTRRTTTIKGPTGALYNSRAPTIQHFGQVLVRFGREDVHLKKNKAVMSTARKVDRADMPQRQFRLCCGRLHLPHDPPHRRGPPSVYTPQILVG